MPFTYTPSDAITLVREYTKRVPIQTVEAQLCDLVNSQMYTALPWRWCTQQISPSIVLENGVQDYQAPTHIYRLLRGRVTLYNTSPVQFIELDVVEYLAPELAQGGFGAIRACAMDQGSGQLRLSLAANIGTPNTRVNIASSTNASPIVITTSTPHGFTTTTNPPMSIEVRGHLVNTAANGIWEVTAPSTTTLSLTGSTGNGVGGATGSLINAMLRFDGEFQVAVAKITSGNLGTNFWFPDHYFPVFVEGLKWRVYQLYDDSRAGALVIAKDGSRSYTGQLGVFMESLQRMMEAEDRGTGQPQQFPDEPLGYGRSQAYQGLFGLY